MIAKGFQFPKRTQSSSRLLQVWRGCPIIVLNVLCAWLIGAHCVSASESGSEAALLKLKQAVVSNYASVVSATYQDSLAAAQTLRTAVDSLLAQPSEKTLAAAREAWRAARVPYCQSEAFRFYDGPIDQIDGEINAWPIDENYIDYVAEMPEGGIINAVAKYPVLSRPVILSLNEKEGKKNISTGFHAVEFLLWGQDLSETGAGERSWRDYADGTKNVERRRKYLRIVTELLAEDLGKLVAAWADGTNGNYRTEFLANADTALGRILKGLGALSGPELAGERLTVPYETKEQEDEQSCFSDNTRDDTVNNALGLRNVFQGRYSRANKAEVKGASLHDLLKQVSPEFASKVSAQVETSVEAAKEIPQPFDQAFRGANAAPGRIAIKKTITALQAQSDLLAQAAKVLSIKLEP